MNYKSVCLDDLYTEAFAQLVKAEAISSSARGRAIWKSIERFEPGFGFPKHQKLRSRPTRLQRSALGAMVVFDQIGFDISAVGRTLYGAYPADSALEELESIVVDDNDTLKSLISNGHIFDVDEVPDKPNCGDQMPWFPEGVLFPCANELQVFLPTIEQHKKYFADLLLARSVFPNTEQCGKFFKLLNDVAYNDALPFFHGQRDYDYVRVVLQPVVRSLRTAIKREIPVFSNAGIGGDAATPRHGPLHEHIYQLIKIQLEGSLNLPEPQSISHALELRNNPAVANLRDGLHRWTESLLTGSPDREFRARQELIAISRSLRSLKDCGKGGRLLTYVSIPVTVADIFLSGGAASGLIATAAGVAVQVVADLKQRKIREQIFSYRPGIN